CCSYNRNPYDSLFIFATPIFRLLGEEEELAVVGGRIALWFIPIIYYFVFNFTMQMYLQSQLKNAIIGWLSTMAFVLHLILSWLFVLKLNLGIHGAMGAMIISTWSVTIGQLVYVIGGWCPGTWTGFSKSAFSELIPVVKLSLTSFLDISTTLFHDILIHYMVTTFSYLSFVLSSLCSLELWYNAALVLLAGYMKNATVSIAAFSICLNIVAWQLMIFFGFLTASCTEVADAVSSLSFLLAMSVFLNSIQPVLTGVAIGAGWQAPVAYVNIACYYAIGIL
ncbi:hypothetical protein IFM89_022891, partial [Coptis chinensis]